MKIYSLGYGGRGKEDLVALLSEYREQGLRVVVDIRLRPDRVAMGSFVRAKDNSKGIAKTVADAKLEYLSLTELGNIFLEFDDWRTRYDELLRLAGRLLVERLDPVREPYCLLCAERDYRICHRLQLANYLAVTRGFEVEHIP